LKLPNQSQGFAVLTEGHHCRSAAHAAGGFLACALSLRFINDIDRKADLWPIGHACPPPSE